MKRFYKILPLIFASALVASCSKTYHCECAGVDVYSPEESTAFEYSISIKESSKEKAKERCARMDGNCALR